MQSTPKTMFLLTCLLVLLAGCLPSTNPLSDPEKDEIDQALIGTWTSTVSDEQGKKEEKLFTVSRPPKGSSVPTGVLLEEREEDGKRVKEFIIPTTVSGVRYYSIPIDHKAAPVRYEPKTGWPKDPIVAFGIFKYEIKNEKIVVYSVTSSGLSKLRDAIDKGEIRGVDHSVPAEPTEGLRKYVKDNESWIFTEKNEFTRVAEKDGPVKSRFPASDPDTDAIDQWLIGTWAVAPQNRLTISRPPKGLNVPKGVLLSESDEGGKKETEFVIPTTIGDVRYLSGGEYKRETGWNKDRTTGYEIVEYEIKGDKLVLYGVSSSGSSELSDAIKKGEIRGQGSNLTEPTPGLRKYIKDNDAWLFTDKSPEATRVVAEIGGREAGSAGGGTTPNPPATAAVSEVSLARLIANPKDYDGKVVRVIGFVSLEFEGNAIYLHQDDYKLNIYKNGLWIDVSDDIQKKKPDFDAKYVLVEGTFNAKETGHMGLWSGSIQKITRFEVRR